MRLKMNPYAIATCAFAVLAGSSLMPAASAAEAKRNQVVVNIRNDTSKSIFPWTVPRTQNMNLDWQPSDASPGQTLVITGTLTGAGEASFDTEIGTIYPAPIVQFATYTCRLAVSFKRNPDGTCTIRPIATFSVAQGVQGNPVLPDNPSCISKIPKVDASICSLTMDATMSTR